MPYMNNDATLADVISPAYVAQQAGIQNDTENAKELTALQTQQAQQPAEIQKPYLANLYQGALTGDVNAKTQAQNLTNQFTQATQPGAIGMTNTENQAKTGAFQVQRLSQLGNIAGQIAGYMDQVPPAGRPAAMAELLQKNGIDPSQLGPLAQGDPDMLRNFSQKAIQQSAQYQTEYMKQGAETERAENVANIQGQSHVQGAQIAADARQAVADLQGRYKQATAGMGALQAQLYAKVANGTATSEERAALDSINQVQQLTRAGMPFQSSITGVQTQPNVPPVPGGGPSVSQPAPTAGAPLQGQAAQAAATAAWGSYEPDKYDYGINPATGQFARRPKGK